MKIMHPTALLLLLAAAAPIDVVAPTVDASLRYTPPDDVPVCVARPEPARGCEDFELPALPPAVVLHAIVSHDEWTQTLFVMAFPKTIDSIDDVEETLTGFERGMKRQAPAARLLVDESGRRYELIQVNGLKAIRARAEFPDADGEVLQQVGTWIVGAKGVLFVVTASPVAHREAARGAYDALLASVVMTPSARADFGGPGDAAADPPSAGPSCLSFPPRTKK